MHYRDARRCLRHEQNSSCMIARQLRTRIQPILTAKCVAHVEFRGVIVMRSWHLRSRHTRVFVVETLRRSMRKLVLDSIAIACFRQVLLIAVCAQRHLAPVGFLDSVAQPANTNSSSSSLSSSSASSQAASSSGSCRGEKEGKGSTEGAPTTFPFLQTSLHALGARFQIQDQPITPFS
jgi:hypothetical protein